MAESFRCCSVTACPRGNHLPLDTPKNAKRFVSIIKPKLAFFIKYDIWPNFLKELQIQNIRTFLISGAFRKDQIYFKPYGGLFREALRVFEHIFLQNETSKELLKTINITNTTVSGDTRFDRVARQLEYDNQLDFVAQFKDQKTCIVAGSTWPEDDALLLEYINTASEDVKFIIAPHEIKNEKIQRLKAQIVKKTVLFSEKKDSLAGSIFSSHVVTEYDDFKQNVMKKMNREIG